MCILNEVLEAEKVNAFLNSTEEASKEVDQAVQQVDVIQMKIDKYTNNLQIIYLLWCLEAEERDPLQKERAFLRTYEGWSGLEEIFDEDNTDWEEYRKQLQEYLYPEEYEIIKVHASNSFRTPVKLFDLIYKKLIECGFRGGNVLDPCVGIGGAFSNVPKEFGNSVFYGTECDPIAYKICMRVTTNIQMSYGEFKDVYYPDNFFDLVIGQTPLSDELIFDPNYRVKQSRLPEHFLIRSLDLLCPGGILALVIPSYVMDTRGSKVLEYLNQRAVLLGAVRIPEYTFTDNLGPNYTSDLVFLQKDLGVRMRKELWTGVSVFAEDFTEAFMQGNFDGILINSYFQSNPEQVIGKLQRDEESGEVFCGYHGEDLDSALDKALSSIQFKYEEPYTDDMNYFIALERMPAFFYVPNFSYTRFTDETGMIDLYYRYNSRMYMSCMDLSSKGTAFSIIPVRDALNKLLYAVQMESDQETLVAIRDELIHSYDYYVEYGAYINSEITRKAFSKDASYYRLCALEKFDDDGEYAGKSDFFEVTKLNSFNYNEVTTAEEALALSLSETAGVDLEFMSMFSGIEVSQLIEQLHGKIFLNPVTLVWEQSNRYLSGNVREKLKEAEKAMEKDERFSINVERLKACIPKTLGAHEIDIRLGATWIDPKYIDQFMLEVFRTPEYLINPPEGEQQRIKTNFSRSTSEWFINGKREDIGNTFTTVTYGIPDANAYQILESTLNLRAITIRKKDSLTDKYVVDKEATALAAQKQDAIKEEFVKWIFSDRARCTELCQLYNELFNSIIPCQYDGSYLRFPGMSSNITLEEHQKNAVAHILYGNNVLLAQKVGAGKTFEMVAAAMESKRLGLCTKSLIVVPNHLIDQWRNDFIRLYPAANILVSAKEDFTVKQLQAFCTQIICGSHDAIIIGHSQFEKIVISGDYQVKCLRAQIKRNNEVINYLVDHVHDAYESDKLAQQTDDLKKELQELLKIPDESNGSVKKLFFEQLGIDKLFIDESHYYKNLELKTKMGRVAGVSTSASVKSKNLYDKCRFMDRLTGERGIVFATGTPISNSMVEMYSNMKYLQYSTLESLKLLNFDDWASTFGETTVAIELAPEGNKYMVRNRFSRFYNIPELIRIFKEVADIELLEDVDMHLPECQYENVTLDASDQQRLMIDGLVERAELIRSGGIDPSTDNMLKITTEGRSLALDPRIIDPDAREDKDCKIATCADKVYRIWRSTMEQKYTQLIFCDISVPKSGNRGIRSVVFNVYDAMRDALLDRGIPAEEIAFIHEYNTDQEKSVLFKNVRSGKLRVLMGSTQKMGAGMNVQKRLVALHHLDIPWRPSDIDQREGRILRRGNECDKVFIFRYLTKGTFDSYNWQIIEAKQRFISQIMTNRELSRRYDDVDETTLTYAEIKALAAGNPLIKEKMDLEVKINKLKLARSNVVTQRYMLGESINVEIPQALDAAKRRLENLKKDKAFYLENREKGEALFHIKIADKEFDDRDAAEQYFKQVYSSYLGVGMDYTFGEYCGFSIRIRVDERVHVSLVHTLEYTLEQGTTLAGYIGKFQRIFSDFDKLILNTERKIVNLKTQLESAKIEYNKPFEQEEELMKLQERLSYVNSQLSFG